MDKWITEGGLYTYAEIHNNDANIIMHVLGMPFVMYGCFRGIPSLFYMNKEQMIFFARSIMSTYILYYSFINWKYGFISYILGMPIYTLSIKHYKPNNGNTLRCILIIFTALYFQEVCGHTLFENVNSRMEIKYISNAILYAPLFCNYHIADLFLKHPFQVSTLYLTILSNFVL